LLVLLASTATQMAPDHGSRSAACDSLVVR
jgi:hypothetical protein